MKLLTPWSVCQRIALYPTLSLVTKPDGITRKIGLLLCTLIFANFANAQITLTGTVTDSTHAPVEFANIILLLQNSNAIIAGAITDEQGKFTIRADQKDSLTLKISYVGFTPFIKPVDTSTNIGTIVLHATSLDEVVVTARRQIVERQVDRLIFNVQNAPFLKGSDGVNVLNRTPGISTQNDKISMLGKNSVRVMINGRVTRLADEELTAYLQSLTAKDIEKIEVITTPPAKYEAGDGNTGMINIILTKKKTDYYSGNVRAMYMPATYPFGGVAGNFNFTKGKWSFSSTANGQKGTRAFLLNSTVEFPTQQWVRDYHQTTERSTLGGRVTLEYALTTNTTIGVQYTGRMQEYPDTSLVYMKIYNTKHTLDSLLTTNIKTTDNKYSHAVNLHVQTKLDTLGKNLSIDLDYFAYNSLNGNLFKAFTPNRSQSKDNTGTNTINMYSGKADLELPYTFAKIEVGAKAFFMNNSSDIKNYDILNEVPVLNIRQSNVFRYTENTQAVYMSATKPLGKKWNAKVGLRVEATQTKGYSATLDQTTRNDYVQLFPTGYLRYTPNPRNAITLSYSRRIQRPSFLLLNPFRRDADIYTYVEGNPLLTPPIFSAVELTHSYNNILESKFFYWRTQSGYGRILIPHPNGVQQFVSKNYFNSDALGVIESVAFNVTKFWETNNDIYVYYMKATSIIPGVRTNNSKWSVYLETNNSFVLNKKKTLFATLTYWYQFPEANNLYDYDAYSQLDIGFRALLLKNKLIVNISGADLLKTNRPRFVWYNNGIKSAFHNYYDNRRLNVSLTYRFGNNKIRGKRRGGSNQTERNRLN